jgi:glycosyltransferase involved in cell wall biosynthesis
VTLSQGLSRFGRVALIHDFLLDLRGGERVFMALCDLFPDADIFSPVYDPVGTEGRFASRGVHTSALNRLRPTSNTFRALLPFYPRAVESLDMSGYDLILSSSSAWSHGVVAHQGQRHLCYCHNPFRYAWDQRAEALEGRGAITQAALRQIFERWRGWDMRVSREVDRYVANGAITRERLARCFGRSSGLLYPPVDIGRFTPGAPSDSFVVLSELMPHKRIDITVQACARLGVPLTVIGDGPDLARLKSLAGPQTEFTGRVTDSEVAERLATSAALIQCATEEFGIASVEAQAAGRPVLALGEGGALETVVPGVTGEHFESADVDTLEKALAAFNPSQYSPESCRRQAERFSRAAFALGIGRELDLMNEGSFAPRIRSRR